jgi:hypothetical protein
MVYQFIAEVFNHFIAPHKLIYLLLAVVNISGIIGIIYAKRYKKSMLELLSWIKTNATITKAEVHSTSYEAVMHRVAEDEQSMYMCKYECSYTVNGSEFTKQFCPDNRIRYYKDESEARSEMEIYPVGKEIYCYYDPKNPSVAVFSLRYSNFANYIATGIFLFMLLASSMLITPLLSREEQPLPFLVFLFCALITGLVKGIRYLMVDAGTVIVPAKFSNGSVRSDVDRNNRMPVYKVLYDITYEQSGNEYTKTISSKPFASQFKAQTYLGTLLKRNGALIRISQQDPSQVLQDDILNKSSRDEKKPKNKYVRIVLCSVTGTLIIAIGLIVSVVNKQRTKEKEILQYSYVFSKVHRTVLHYYFESSDAIRPLNVPLDIKYLEQEGIDLPLVKDYLKKKKNRNETVELLTSSLYKCWRAYQDNLEAKGVVSNKELNYDSLKMMITHDVEKISMLNTAKKVVERVE